MDSKVKEIAEYLRVNTFLKKAWDIKPILEDEYAVMARIILTIIDEVEMAELAREDERRWEIGEANAD